MFFKISIKEGHNCCYHSIRLEFKQKYIKEKVIFPHSFRVFLRCRRTYVVKKIYSGETGCIFWEAHRENSFSWQRRAKEKRQVSCKKKERYIDRKISWFWLCTKIYIFSDR